MKKFKKRENLRFLLRSELVQLEDTQPRLVHIIEVLSYFIVLHKEMENIIFLDDKIIAE